MEATTKTMRILKCTKCHMYKTQCPELYDMPMLLLSVQLKAWKAPNVFDVPMIIDHEMSRKGQT